MKTILFYKLWIKKTRLKNHIFIHEKWVSKIRLATAPICPENVGWNYGIIIYNVANTDGEIKRKRVGDNSTQKELKNCNLKNKSRTGNVGHLTGSVI